MTRDPHEQLTKYLADAHSIEEQALAQLREAPEIAGEGALADAFREHLVETERHEQTVRGLLEARGAEPSLLKDTVMKIGGKGFVLFARLQPDSPGKLAAHAHSYEGLEEASYALLALTAERVGEPEVREAALRIRDDEQAMRERIEGLFDQAVEASLRELGVDDLKEQLRKYLADQHAIEEQSAQLLEGAPALARDSALRPIYEQHLAETRRHAERIEERLDALGGDPSTLKDAFMRLGAMNWAGFFAGHPDTPGKLAAFAYAFEQLEIGGLEQLKRVAQRAGDAETVTTAEEILAEERVAAEKIASLFDAAAAEALAEQDVSPR